MEENDNWIEKFKRISWEPEILISGGILFTLFQAKSGLVIVHNQFHPLALIGFKIVIIFLTLSISALTVGFTIHLIIKSYWIALLALKSVFPKGINNNKINYSENFWQKTSIDLTLTKKIASVGNASSLMFTISFLALFIILGVLMYLILIMALGHYFTDYLPPQIWYLVFIPVVFAFVDFITLGGLKKSRIISKIYYPMYQLISWVTLSFLYREILYTIISNISKKKIALFSIVFISLSVLLTVQNSSGFMNIFRTTFENWEYRKTTFSNSIDERKYENLRQPTDQVFLATIQSDIISDNYIKLYVRYRPGLDWTLDSLANVHPALSLGQLINKKYIIRIDNQQMDSISWFFTTKKDINQPGLIGYFTIKNIPSGTHLLHMETNLEEWIYTIPFWKE